MNKKTVALGLSGGVDSAVSAKLLIDQGYEVIGFFMRNWDSQLNNDIKGNKTLDDDKCSQEYDYDDAKKIADLLGIKIVKLNFVKEYYERVFEKSLKLWKKGVTPNPDVFCNRYIKYDAFISKVKKEFKVDYISMGHYASIKKIKGVNYLTLSKDRHKDQTYFLSEINRNVLDSVIFPLSNYKKSEVRELAKKWKFPVAEKKDSTGICFIGERDFQKFLENYLKISKGSIVDITSNKKVGIHNGVSFYTIGQRRGLNLGGNPERYFVAKKDLIKNIVYVCPESKKEFLYKKNMEVIYFNYLVDKDFLSNYENKTYMVKFRHSEYMTEAKVSFKKNIIEINFLENQEALTEGQEAVLYTNDRHHIVIGGGIISKIF